MTSPRWWTKPLPFALLPLLLILPSCATLIPTAVPNAPLSAYCQVDRAISYDRLNDTAPTITEVKAHNAVFDGLCTPKTPQ